jgi:hypothetical protein
MQNSENNIDRLFRDKLLNHKVVPPSGVWNNIVNDLETKGRKKRMIWLLGFSSAASLLLAFLAGWYVAVKLPAEKDIQAEALQLKTEKPSLKATTNPSNQKIIFRSNDTHFFSQDEKKQQTENTVLTSQKSERENIVVMLLSPLKPFLLPTRNNTSNLIAMNSEGFSDADRAIIAMNTEKTKVTSKSEKHQTWAVGVQASPIYRFDKASAVADQASNPKLNSVSPNGSANYVTNISGGIKVELNTSSRLSVQSGVNYGEIAQNGGDVGVSFTGHNWVNDRSGTDATKEFVSNPSGSNSLSNNMTLNTQMGLANISMPDGANLSNDKVTNSISPEVARNFNLKQKADYLEFPLIVRYKIIDSRVDFLLLGGINTNVLISNNVSLSDKQEVIGSGKIDGLNPLTFSSSVGLGVNYSISDHFNLSLEPTFKMQLNSLNKQSGYNSKPGSIGIFTGLSYQF